MKWDEHAVHIREAENT